MMLGNVTTETSTAPEATAPVDHVDQAEEYYPAEYYADDNDQDYYSYANEQYDDSFLWDHPHQQ